MSGLFTVLLILLALSSIVLTMYFVLRERRHHDEHLRYRRSPWEEAEAAAAEQEATDAEKLTEPLMVPNPEAGAHVPLSDDITPDDDETTA